MARNTDRRARGNRARPSGQDPSARLGNGLAAQSGPASRAARTHPRTPRPCRNADPSHSAAATPARDHPQRSGIFTPWRPSPGGVMAWKATGVPRLAAPADSVTRRNSSSISLAAFLGRKLGRKPSPLGICTGWCSPVAFCMSGVARSFRGCPARAQQQTPRRTDAPRRSW